MMHKSCIQSCVHQRQSHTSAVAKVSVQAIIKCPSTKQPEPVYNHTTSLEETYSMPRWQPKITVS